MTGVRRRLSGVIAAAGLAAALAGCASEQVRQERLEREAEINVYPTSYRADLVAAMRAYVNDPANVRDAWVAEPAIVQVGPRRRYAACVRFSARNDNGRYAGRNALAVFSQGRFDQFIEAAASTDPASQESLSALMKERCEAAEYKRFPELEAMKR
jgi:hypothetical protein